MTALLGQSIFGMLVRFILYLVEKVRQERINLKN